MRDMRKDKEQYTDNRSRKKVKMHKTKERKEITKEKYLEVKQRERLGSVMEWTMLRVIIKPLKYRFQVHDGKGARIKRQVSETD